MEYKKGMMKIYLAENLRKLILKKPFDKITIKQICDETGVIRATFYNYFQDKYDCLNYIIFQDIVINSFPNMIAKENDIVIQILKNIANNKEFYRYAFAIEGQNSFEELLKENLSKIIERYFDNYRIYNDAYDCFNNKFLGDYYAQNLCFLIKYWVMENPDLSLSSLEKSVHLLSLRNIHQYINNTN